MKSTKKFLKKEKLKLAGHIKAIQNGQLLIYRTVLVPVIGEHFNKLKDEGVDIKVNMNIMLQKIGELLNESKNESFIALSEVISSDEVGKMEFDQEAIGRFADELKKFVTYELVKAIDESYDSKKEMFETIKQGVIADFENRTRTKLESVLGNDETLKGVELTDGNNGN